MNLFIEIDENGNPINHPALMDNLVAAFGHVPEHWKPFIRVQKPTDFGVYQICSEEPKYEFNANLGYWMDVWTVRDMTDQEKADKQQQAKEFWTQRPNLANFSAWTFNEETCRYEPPIPRPDDGKAYRWDGATNSWVEFTLPV